MHRFITAKELALRYSVTEATILAWQRRGWIPCLKAGQRPILFDPIDVDAALKSRGATMQDDPRERIFLAPMNLTENLK